MSDASQSVPVPGGKIYIYGLYDETGCRYVGQAADLKKRLKDHLADKRRTHKANWIRKLLSEGKTPEMRTLEETDAEHFQEKERAWIAFGRKKGWKLTNATNGGIGTRGLKHNEETRRKMGAAKIGNTWNIGRLTGNVISQEQRERTSRTMTGRKLTEEHKKNISEAGKGRVQSAETRKKLSELHTGKVMSAEARRKMSDAKRGKAPWNKGRTCGPLAESTRKKLSEAMREYRRKKKLGLVD